MSESQRPYEPSNDEFYKAYNSMSDEEAGLTEKREKDLESQEIVTGDIIHTDLVIAPINGKLYRRWRPKNRFSSGDMLPNEQNSGPQEVSKEEAEKELDKAEENVTRKIEYFTKQLENIKNAREILSKQS